MACISAESACVGVDALFASCWEQNDSLTRFVCSMISAPRLVISKWIRPCEQATVEVQSVPAVPAVALPVVALLEEAASTDAEAETVYSTEARKADAATVTVTVSIQVEEAEEAKKPVQLKNKASSFLELLAQEDSVASHMVVASSSAKVAAWLGVETESQQAEKVGAEFEQGGKMGAEASSGSCSLTRSESSCSSRSACLIHLSSDSSSSANSLCSSPTRLTAEAARVKRRIGRGVSSAGKGRSLSTDDHFSLKPTAFTELLAAEENSPKRRVGEGLSSSGNGRSMEGKGFGKAEEEWIVSNQLFGCDDGEEEEEEDGSSKQSFRTLGTGTMCYMNQLYMDEEEEEEREALAASGISLGIGRFGARRRITGSSSRVTLRRMSAALRQY